MVEKICEDVCASKYAVIFEHSLDVRNGEGGFHHRCVAVFRIKITKDCPICNVSLQSFQ